MITAIKYFACSAAVMWSLVFAARVSTASRRGLLTLSLAVAALGGYRVAHVALSNARTPDVWDYPAFRVWAHTVARGGNPYVPVDVRAAIEPETPTDSVFVREVVDAGLVYPPPMGLVLWPFGRLSPITASLGWHALSLLGFLLAIPLLWKLGPWRSPWAILPCAALVLSWATTTSTVRLGQTNGIVLMLASACAVLAPGWFAGVAAALSLVMKPFMAVLAVPLVLSRAWRSLGAMAATYVVLLAAALAAFGWEHFRAFLVNGPLTRVPPFLYSEPVNQSLLAWCIRAGVVVGSPTASGLYVALVLILATVTFWCTRAPGARDQSVDQLALASWLSLGLLLYPGTLFHYSVLLLLPLVVFATASRTGVERAATVLIAGMTSALCAASDGLVTGAAIMLVWGIGCAATRRRIRGGLGTPASPEPG